MVVVWEGLGRRHKHKGMHSLGKPKRYQGADKVTWQPRQGEGHKAWLGAASCPRSASAAVRRFLPCVGVHASSLPLV